ncbi:PRC-barrel domain-containing protein [Micromonospora sp. NPDC050686]|uniref:PRC-barrel domain-containing protein n=1 Tax=Micromonospora sp. NPDC050686 TaxID=3154631 RepID=UPI0033CD71ED
MDRLDPQHPNAIPESTIDGGQGGYAAGTPGGAFDPWRYRDEAGVAGADLVGYKVEATDGHIGKIDRASHDVDDSYLVVDTGPWIFGKKVMLPAGTVNRVDHDESKVYVDREKDQIKAAPEYDETSHTDPAYRDKLGGYYGENYSALPPDAPGRV